MEVNQIPAHSAPTVLALLDNLFFAAKINAAASQTNTRIIYAKTSDQALKLARIENPFQIILDLDAAKCSPLEFLSQLKADITLQTIPTLGFVSHVALDLQSQAREAGCDRIMARSSFDRNLPTILSQKS